LSLLTFYFKLFQPLLVLDERSIFICRSGNHCLRERFSILTFSSLVRFECEFRIFESVTIFQFRNVVSYGSSADLIVHLPVRDKSFEVDCTPSDEIESKFVTSRTVTVSSHKVISTLNSERRWECYSPEATTNGQFLDKNVVNRNVDVWVSHSDLRNETM